ncbi:MAG TPA: class I SAM-dependent methyltransferase [Acidimicrobiales bacterium]|nr:class I SAM-dependent methyltransferase [Acidimicrobiales bacterium]
MASNEAERQRWNDEYWTSVWPRRESMTSIVTDYLIDALAPVSGERVLEVGSGGGTATLAIAQRLAAGSVVGADISENLVELARSRVAERGVTNVTFVVADAQVDVVVGGPFDAVVSQFGVMFFDDRVQAFANLRAQTAAQGRLVFVCWGPVELNPWFLGSVIAPFLEPPPPPSPDKSPTGPFALSDVAQTVAMLTSAGWCDVQCTQHATVAQIERSVLVDDDNLRHMGLVDDDLDAVRRALDAHLAPLTGPDGVLRAPLVFLVVTGRNPLD